MNDYAWTGQFAAPAAVAAGGLLCFFGYRILKLTLGITGFILGAGGGWTAGTSIAPGHDGIALLCAAVGGILGAILCVWLFFLGVFLVGLSAGAVVAAAVFDATGHQASPLVLAAVAIGFGLLALVLQKLMIIVSTAFSGSYLIAAGILQLAHLAPKGVPLWFERLPAGTSGVLGYVVLAVWVILGLVGIRFQYRGAPKKAEPAAT